jgi:propanol-preferring alcohol dehydrogenase
LQARLSGYTIDAIFQQYCIAKGAHVARIPKNTPLDALAPTLCAGITVYKGLKESGARPGQTLAIVGAKRAIGLEVITIDGGAEKNEMTKKLGPRSFVDFETSKGL